MATFSWVLSLFFMLSWAIYVGVVEDELQDGADGDRYSTSFVKSSNVSLRSAV